MTTLNRNISASLLCILFTVIVMGPPVMRALQLPALTHAITGECSGDCTICGCSPERSANHTCCCWQKKSQHLQHDDDLPDCCKKIHGEEQRALTLLSQPCGSNKNLITWADSFDLLPLCTNRLLPRFDSKQYAAFYSPSRADWSGEPPDPPPEQHIRGSAIL